MDVFRYFCMHTYVFLLAYGVLKDDRVVFSCSELLDLLITFKVRKASLRDNFPIYNVLCKSHMFRYERNKFIGRKCTFYLCIDTLCWNQERIQEFVFMVRTSGAREARENLVFSRNTFKLLAFAPPSHPSPHSLN